MTKETQKQVETVTAEAQKTMGESVEKLTRGMEQAASFGQENLDAVVASSRIAAKAHETAGAEVAAYTKKSYEDSLAAAKELAAAKSLPELVEKQTTFARTALEAYVSEATKINDIYVNATREAIAPLNDRFTKAVEKVRGARG
ncbi:MAG TPA: TIGR01841 family phasin [Thermohalobaculum sp.]|nr:TIGR01841 family phasin [Thermohalobaculum sp.]